MGSGRGEKEARAEKGERPREDPGGISRTPREPLRPACSASTKGGCGPRTRALTGRGRGRGRQAREKAAAVADADGRERLDGGEWPRGENERLGAALARVDGFFTLCRHEKEIHVGGGRAPVELERGALGEVADGVADEDLHGREAGARVARALDEDAPRWRAGGGGGGGRGRERR